MRFIHPFISSSFSNLKMDYPSVDRDFYKHSPIYQGHLYCDVLDERLYADRYPEYSFVSGIPMQPIFFLRDVPKQLGFKSY